MELHEIRKQEPLEETLRATLEPGLRAMYGRPFDITLAPKADAQPWLVQPRLSAFFTKDASREVRKFMTDRFRFTPVTMRVPFQWAYGTALGSRPAIRRSRPAFHVDPPLPGAGDVLVIPGSRRVRVFDFGSGKTRSLLKSGFRKDAIAAEVAVRSEEGPFVPVTATDPRGDWFEEDIIPGYPLPRCPPWWDRSGIERTAIEILRDWHATHAEETDAAQYAGTLVDGARAALATIAEKHPQSLTAPDPGRLEELAATAARAGTVTVTTTHGDFQPGNIHVAFDGRRPVLIDWEYTGRRSAAYDLVTYGLKVRYSAGVGARLTRWLETGDTGPADPIEGAGTRTGRAHIGALYVLEELERGAVEAASSNYSAPPHGFRVFCAEMAKLDWRVVSSDF